MNEFTSYDMAILVYENYLDLDSLKNAIEDGKRGIRQIIRAQARAVKLIKDTEPERNIDLIDEDKELEKFKSIENEIKEMEF